jgi:hypothetical protein
MSRQKEVRLRKEEKNRADLKECYYYYLGLFFISLKNVLFTYLSQLYFKFISQTSKFHIVEIRYNNRLNRSYFLHNAYCMYIQCTPTYQA